MSPARCLCGREALPGAGGLWCAGLVCAGLGRRRPRGAGAGSASPSELGFSLHLFLQKALLGCQCSVQQALQRRGEPVVRRSSLSAFGMSWQTLCFRRSLQTLPGGP